MRSRKGVTPAIATVLLIGIVVSSTGAAFTFIMTSQGEITDNLESDLTNTELRENTRFNIESIERTGNPDKPLYKITVRNTGSVEINMSSQNLDVFVDDTRREDIEVEDDDGDNILTPNEAGTASIQVTSENPRIRFIGPYDSSDTFVFNGGEDNWPDINTGYCGDKSKGLFEDGQAQCDTGDIIEGENLDSYNLENADTSDIEIMFQMFQSAENFNQDISSWDTSNVETMERMFKNAENFNRDISSWDTSNVETTKGMFNDADSFNQNISSWDTSNVNDMRWMFRSAKNFDQNISSWCVEQINTKPDGFDSGEVGFKNEEAKQPNWGETC